jgi:hypothetical protein
MVHLDDLDERPVTNGDVRARLEDTRGEPARSGNGHVAIAGITAVVTTLVLL